MDAPACVQLDSIPRRSSPPRRGRGAARAQRKASLAGLAYAGDSSTRMQAFPGLSPACFVRKVVSDAISIFALVYRAVLERLATQGARRRQARRAEHDRATSACAAPTPARPGRCRCVQRPRAPAFPHESVFDLLAPAPGGGAAVGGSGRRRRRRRRRQRGRAPKPVHLGESGSGGVVTPQSRKRRHDPRSPARGDQPPPGAVDRDREDRFGPRGAPRRADAARSGPVAPGACHRRGGRAPAALRRAAAAARRRPRRGGGRAEGARCTRPAGADRAGGARRRPAAGAQPAVPGRVRSRSRARPPVPARVLARAIMFDRTCECWADARHPLRRASRRDAPSPSPQPG
jgi:hypothetical protein